MADSLSLTSDVAAAGTALGGLLLVFLGNATSGFDGFDTTAQDAVRAKFQLKAWAAVLGIVLALLSAAFALAAKRFDNECAASISAVLLGLAVLWVIGTAIGAARSIG